MLLHLSRCVFAKPNPYIHLRAGARPTNYHSKTIARTVRTILAKVRKHKIQFDMANDDDRRRMLGHLQEHFSKVAPEEQSARWNKMWEEQTTPWDRKAPSKFNL